MPQYSADRRTLGELLSLTAPIQRITVPDWQRSYSWDTNEVKAFWDDLQGFNRAYPGNNAQGHEYFLGSIVVVEKSDEYELLDGQQRLATATILLSVIRSHIRDYNENAASGLERDFIVKENFTTSERVYKLKLGQYDSEFFRREIQDSLEGDTAPPSAELLSHKRIRRVKEYFDTRFQEEYERLGGGKAAYEWALEIQRVLTDHLSVVEVRSVDEDNAAEVFETLNYRGIDLSTTDLLRNLVLRRSSDSDREEINDSWENIFQLEDRVEEFLRHWWLSYYGDLTGRGLFKAFKPKIMDGELTSIGLTRQLRDAADTYQMLLDCLDGDHEVASLLRDIKDLGARLLYPVLLSTYSKPEYETQKRRILKSLVSLFVRYNVISRLEGTRLEPEVYDIARQLRTDTAVQYVDRMRRIAPDDEKFVADFRSVQVPRQATARYLLREIENARHATPELQIQGTSRVHLEHIYPQRPTAGHRLDDHDAILNRLGNLTLLSARLNRELRNAPFDKKQPKYEESELLITKELKDYDEWNLGTIDKRQRDFAEQAPHIWAFPD